MVSEFYIKSEGWEQRKLKDICSDITIGLVKTMTKYYREKGVPLIRNSDIKENKIRKETLVYLDEVFAEENNDKRLKAGDIVTVHTGDIGTSAVIDQELHGAHGFATLNTRVKKDIIDEYYLCYYFNSPYFKNQAYSVSTGDGRNNLNLKDFINTTILFPTNLEEQRKIAAILSSVDEAIEKTEAIIEQTEKVKKGLMQQLLTKGIGHTKFKKTEIGEIPEEWEVCKIPDVLSDEKGSIKMGPFGSQIKKEDLTSSGVHIIGIENVLNKEYVHLGNRYISLEKFESLKTNQVLPGDVVITTMGTIGLADVIPEHIPTTIIDSHLIRLRVNQEKILNTYLAMIIQDYDLVKKQIKRMSQGGIMAGLNTSIIKSLTIPLPSLDEQRKIVNSLSSIDSKVQAETEKLIKLREIKKGLMQVLLTGKVRVKVDDEVMSQ